MLVLPGVRCQKEVGGSALLLGWSPCERILDFEAPKRNGTVTSPKIVSFITILKFTCISLFLEAAQSAKYIELHTYFARAFFLFLHVMILLDLFVIIGLIN